MGKQLNQEESMSNDNQSAAAATDVTEFLSDLDAGIFERKLSVALSQAAAAVTDHDKVGEVTVKLNLSRIPGTHQVTVAHTLKFQRPTADGKRSEEATRKTVMHVGKNGVMSLMPANQLNIPGVPAKA